jgi:hypothetical protein
VIGKLPERAMPGKPLLPMTRRDSFWLKNIGFHPGAPDAAALQTRLAAATKP